MNLYPPWIFPMEPRQTSPLVMGAWIWWGIYFLCTWYYFHSCRRSWFLNSKVSPGMMVLGMRLSENNPFVVKKFRIFDVLRNIWLVRRCGILYKVRLWRVALHCSFTTLIRLLMSGTCSFAPAIFTSGPPVRDSIRLFKVQNLRSACTLVMRNPWCS